MPPADANFQMTALEGTWYEIGKIQTPGGAFFEGDCVCTKLDYQSTSKENANVANICNKKTPEGKRVVANATISPRKNGNPG